MSRCGAPAAAPLAERSLRAASITAESILAEGDGQVRRRPGRIDVGSRGGHGELKNKPTVTLHTTAAFFIVGNRLYTQLLGPEAHQRAHTGHRTAQFYVGEAGMGPCCTLVEL